MNPTLLREHCDANCIPVDNISVSCYTRKMLLPDQSARFSRGNVFQKVGSKPQVRACIILNLRKRFCKRFRSERAFAILLIHVFLVATVVNNRTVVRALDRLCMQTLSLAYIFVKRLLDNSMRASTAWFPIFVTHSIERAL